MAGGGVNPNRKRHEHDLCYTGGLPPYKCSGCKGRGANIGHTCPSCPEFVLHETCAVLPDEVVHPFFPDDPFKFRATTHLRHDCDACGVLIRGFLFDSRRGGMFHPLCLDLPRQLRHGGHPYHDLGLNTNQERGKYSCMLCKKEHKKWKYLCTVVPCAVELDMNCAIVDIHRLSQHGITQVYKPSKTKHALKKVAKVGKSIGATVAGAVLTAVLGEAGSALASKGTRVDPDGGEDKGGSDHGELEGHNGP